MRHARRPTYAVGTNTLGRKVGIDLLFVQPARRKTMVDLTFVGLKPDGWAAIDLKEADILLGATHLKPGTAASTYIRDWTRAGWLLNRRTNPHSKIVEVRWTHKGKVAFAAVGLQVPYVPSVAPLPLIEKRPDEDFIRVNGEPEEPEVEAYLAKIDSEMMEITGLPLDVPPTPAIHTSTTGEPIIRSLLAELTNVLVSLDHPKVACNHTEELAELDALRQWRDTVLRTKP